jgi:hypothetical protein
MSDQFITFEKDVFPEEWETIDLSRVERLGESPHQPRDRNDPYPDAGRLHLAGLALSGGGIRSATFGLGVIQALAKQGLLKRFDYLSTVSGGGYIGSWLSGWTYRVKCAQPPGILNVEQVLAESIAEEPGAAESRALPEPEHDEHQEPSTIRFLRQYSNYLTPEAGFFSADTWASIATYARNSFLNVLPLIFGFAAVLLVPRLLASGSHELAKVSEWNHLVAIVGGLLLVVAMGFISRNLGLIAQQAANPGAAHDHCAGGGVAPAAPAAPEGTDVVSIQRNIIAPLLVVGLLASVWLGFDQEIVKAAEGTGGGQWLRWAGMNAVFYFLLCLAGGLLSGVWGKSDYLSSNRSIKNLLWAIPAGLVGGLLLKVIVAVFGTWRLASGEPNYFLIVSFGPSLMLLLAAVVVSLHVGFTGRLLDTENHEWWLRLSAWLMIYTVAWLALFGAALLLPFLFYKLEAMGSLWWQSGGVAWLMSTIAGVLAGRSQTTGHKGAVSWVDWIAKIAPYIFVVGFVGLVSLGLHEILLKLRDNGTGPGAADWLAYWTQMDQTSGMKAVQVFLASVLIAALLSWRIDINIFSLHSYYRNRLIRAYLGASRGNCGDFGGKRTPNLFTGFDPNDNLPMAGLATSVGPYHIVNTALNLVQGDKLAWQQRKASSFVFTPKFCGFETWTPDDGRPRPACSGYRPTGDYAESPSLGTALAISGAAFSPNMGYHSSPAVTFLLTVFNSRLGVWFGNPSHPTGWKKRSPLFSLRYLALELFGLTNERRAFVYLSDGGHFENLGIYELVRRRCKYILAVDAGQDRGFSFEDLGNAIRKCRIDFNTEISIDVAPLCPRRRSKTERRKKDEAYSDRHWAVGTITYPDDTQGILVYLKPTLIGDEPGDVRNYAAEHPEFPHQSTNDQWFDEPQFESYRRLGYHIGRKALKEIPQKALEGIPQSDDPAVIALVGELKSLLSA